MDEKEISDAIEYSIIETAALGLLKRWFPKTIPTDIEKWSEIAYDDVVAVFKALDEEGYVITTKDERTDK
jgi:hypothetical protein